MKQQISQAVQLIRNDILEGQNIDVYIAILAGIIITFLDLFGIVNFEITIPAILLVLMLVVFSLMSNRRSLANVEKSLESLEKTSYIFKQLEFPGEELGDRLRRSQKISLLGRTLSRIVPHYHADIEYALKQGTKLKVMLLDPDGPAVEKAAMVSASVSTLEAEKIRIQNTTEYLKQILRRVPDAELELKFLKYDAPYSMIIINSADGDLQDYCLVRISTFRKPLMESPSINPDPIKDKYWFDFFVAQYEDLWTSEISCSVKLL